MRGATSGKRRVIAIVWLFQSTLLMRGATTSAWDWSKLEDISIHAPHARSDNRILPYTQPDQSISIHAPHARSDAAGGIVAVAIDVISIHAPHARSDISRRPSRIRITISIHAPHARSDVDMLIKRLINNHFNPRSSCEERPTRTRRQPG